MKTAIGLFVFIITCGSVFAQAITVNFDAAKVVYLDENHVLNKIDDHGTTSAVLNTNVGVAGIHFSEQGDLFVVFQAKQQFADGNYYLLAKAVTTNNVIYGIDSNLESIAWGQGSGLSPGVQSDSSGNLYYLANQPDGKLALKKCVGGAGTNIVNLINDNVTVCEWLTRRDGTILLGGWTQSTGSKWLRKITPDNNLSSLALNASVTFLLDFPDDRAYAGIWYDAPYFGVYRLPVALTSFDGSTPYIGGSWNSPEYDVNALTNGHNSTYVEGLTSSGGSTITKCAITDNGRVIVLAGSQLYRKTIVQYYPAPPEIIEPTLIDSPTLIEKMSDLLLIAGTKNGANALVLYDPATSNETSLLNEDIEIYHMKSLSDGYVWLDGLKFNGNRYVVGKIQITTNTALNGTFKAIGQFQELATLSGKPMDLAGMTRKLLQAPGGVSASDGTYANMVQVTWNASIGAANYEVWRSTANNPGSAEKISGSNLTGTIYDDTTAAAGTIYYYWVKALNSGSISCYSIGDRGYCGSTNAVIGPVIKANGQLDNVTIGTSDSLSVSVQLNPGEYIGNEVDWWVIALAGSSWYYMNDSFMWTPFDGMPSHCRPVNRGALFNLPATEVLNTSGLQAGLYTFWFAVDVPMDGHLNLDGPILLDSVNIAVQ